MRSRLALNIVLAGGACLWTLYVHHVSEDDLLFTLDIEEDDMETHALDAFDYMHNPKVCALFLLSCHDMFCSASSPL